MANNFNSSIQRNDLGQALIPDEISQEIIQTMPEKSVMLTRAKRMRMSTKKKTQPVLATLPEAYWVSEGGLKETTKSGWEDMKPLIAEAGGKKIDQAAIFGVDKPSTWGNDILTGAKNAKNTITQGTGKDLAADVASLGKTLAKEGCAINGFASKPGLNWELTELCDANNRPIYTPNLTDKQPSKLYGYPCNEVLNGSWDDSKAVLLAADWSKFIVGIRQDITYKVFDQGVISNSSGAIVYNAMQQDSQIMRVVMRVGFQVANPVTRVAKKGTQYPAGFIVPASSDAHSESL